MKQKLFNQFSLAVQSWDKSHRLVGKERVDLLIEQSNEALEYFLSAGGSAYNCIIDVGAGSGLLGFPLLFIHDSIRVCFVEPDLKKASFIVNFLSSLDPAFRNRAKVLMQNIEDVSRETIISFSGGEDFAMLSRAFSGSRSLSDSIKHSKLSKYPVFQFNIVKESQKKEKCLFEPLKDS